MDSAKTFDILCGACQRLFDINTYHTITKPVPNSHVPTGTQWKSHLTFAALKISAKSGCHLCNLILDSLNVVSLSNRGHGVGLDDLDHEKIQLGVTLSPGQHILVSSHPPLADIVLEGSLSISLMVWNFKNSFKVGNSRFNRASAS